MLERITNHSMTVGKHKSTVCEWINKDNSRCCDKPIFGKPYCKEHMARAYTSVSVKDFEKETDAVIKEVKTIEELGIVLEDEVAENDSI